MLIVADIEETIAIEVDRLHSIAVETARHGVFI